MPWLYPDWAAWKRGGGAPPTIVRIAPENAPASPSAKPPIRLFLADVDGTLVTQDKILTDAAIAAVRHLREAGVLFALTSGRPPKGMEMLLAPLQIDTPIAAFNGGMMVDKNLHAIEQRTIPDDLVQQVIDHMKSFELDVWLYRGADWYVPDPKAPHVDREAWTVKFEPKVRKSFDGLLDGVVKLVGVSDDHDAIDKAAKAAAEKFGDHVTAAASQPYYLDVTSPQANKGEVARYLARSFTLEPEEIATIGDQPNDILMFEHSGLTIAMGNADPAVKKAARETSRGNEDEGFAYAVEHFVLPAASS
jgi:Cof subfamily protein (haloacid dehalogenase superfamily)